MKNSKKLITVFILSTSLMASISHALDTYSLFKTKITNESAVQVKVSISDGNGKSLKKYEMDGGDKRKFDVYHGCKKVRYYKFTVEELQFNKVVTTGSYTLTTGKQMSKDGVTECKDEIFKFTKCEDADSSDFFKTTCHYIYANDGRKRNGKITIKAD